MLEHIDLSALNENNASQCQRLFHGRGHAFPGYEHINIDWLPPVAVITLYKDEPHSHLLELARELTQAIPACRSVQVQYRHRLKGPFEVLLGEAITDTVVDEDGLKYHIQLGQAQNTGLFVDMRNGRQWVKEHAKDKRVLNLFAYTCAFSVAAIAGDAAYVLNVDNNEAALSRGRKNHQLNHQDLSKVNFEGVNIFKSYSRLRKRGPYDLLICDPPAYQIGSVDIKRDYRKIIRRVPEWMNPEGKLMLCLNSPKLTAEFLYDAVEQECPDCHFIEEIKTPAVFKEAMPGKGLKVLIFSYNPQE